MHVLITGGSRGIGAEVARLAGARGWNVTLNYLADEAAARHTVRAVEEAGGRAAAFRGDAAWEPDVIAMWDAAEAGFGPVTGFVNNAGIVAPSCRLAEMDLVRIERVLRTNVLGALLGAREAARRMAKGRGGAGGAIVNVSSIAATLGSPGEYIDYAASKGAVDTLTVGLARELAREGVRVNGVRPGLIETDIHASGGRPDRVAELSHAVPMGRGGRTPEVAEAILWLLSDAASYVTGTSIDVSGGR
jgi:NAD(P)-dependent dehydrogenase (short-subunit alcohol dehydrogenase family)